MKGSADHDGADRILQERPQKATAPSKVAMPCPLGCSYTAIPNSIRAHVAQVAHRQCVACRLVFTEKLAKDHAATTGHTESLPLDAAAQDADTASVDAKAVKANTPKADTTGVDATKATPAKADAANATKTSEPPETPETPLAHIQTQQLGYSEAIRSLCSQLGDVAEDTRRRGAEKKSRRKETPSTRLDDATELLNRFFPCGRDLPFARIGSSLADNHVDVDVVYTTQSDMARHASCGAHFTKPIVIKYDGPVLDEFTQTNFRDTLRMHMADGTMIDVQDMGTSDKSAVKMAVEDVLARLDQDGQPPINLLNLKPMLPGFHAPVFLREARFGAIPAVNARMAAAAARGPHAMVRQGKQDDLGFSLYGQRGATSGFHIDNPDGTWAFNVFGRKVWIFPRDRSKESLQEFARDGDDWAPRVVFVVLEPGDTLVMPAGEIIPHAVLTLQDSYMIGGMFLDLPRLPDTLAKMLWVGRHPSVTNDATPRQLLEGMVHLRDLYLGSPSPDQALFDCTLTEIQSVMSCSCPPPCSPSRCKDCRCRSLDILQGECGPWCACRRPRKRKRRR